MRLGRILAQRLALGAIAAWAVLTVMFALFAATEDWVLDRRLALAAYGGADPDELESIRQSYLANRGLDRPLTEQYVDWMGNMITLEWGNSFQSGEAVFPLVREATLETALYVVPAIVLATTLGLAVGVYAAMNVRSIRGNGAMGIVYLLFAIPNFWAGFLILSASATAGATFRWGSEFNWIVETELPFLYGRVLPVVLVTTTLLAAIVSYARAYARQYYTADLTKLVRAKGGGRLDVARHVLRNAAIPLLSLVFAETLALLAISVIIIEAVFGIGGLGSLFYNAVWARDLPVMMGVTVVIVAFGIVGNVVQDLAYSLLDPRVDTGSR
ncbi:ABC transporter permease [Natronosalvus halobius]|uniref:ABC transporter permease n=1 Tax=Natronosalvus halobius TaxID=2953746 RepID=UPI0020A1518E|nr:ABC transporter permease [Natronosalvus halobius]USZ72779.1 ABC transporter permease [Natronosalvus halobius]